MDESTAKVSFLELNRAIWGGTSDQPAASRFLANFRIRGFESPGAFITSAYPYLFSLAGLVLFVMLIWGSLEIFLGASSTKLADQGKKRITAALIGFFILFAAFWIGQITATIFGLDIGLTTTPDPYSFSEQTR